MSAGRPVVPAIRVPEEGLGPCMLALSPAMRAYVVARVFYGLNRARAAEAAGYSAANKDVAKVQGYRLEHDERIQAAIGEESRKLMRAEGPKSIRVLLEIRDDKKNEPKDRRAAAEAILDRCGLGAISQSHLTVDHNVRLSEEQLDRRILELCKELNLAPAEAQKLLIDPAKIVDAEFEEVTPTPEEVERRAALDHENTLRRLRAAMTPDELAEHKEQMLELRSATMKTKRAAAEAERHAQTEIDDDLAELLAPIMPGELDEIGDDSAQT